MLCDKAKPSLVRSLFQSLGLFSSDDHLLSWCSICRIVIFLWLLFLYRKSVIALSLLRIIVYQFYCKEHFVFLQQALQRCLQLLIYYQRDLPFYLHDPEAFYFFSSEFSVFPDPWPLCSAHIVQMEAKFFFWWTE